MTRIIFTLSTGRCGTKYLSQVLNTVPGVTATHEPDPNFVTAWKMPIAERREWLRKVKLPAIPNVPVYVETSHLLNLGFVEPLVDLGVDFEVIWLTRSLEQVALSYYRAGTIPGRTAVGRNYCPAPDHPDNILYYKDYSNWSEFTLCHWIAHEKDARNERYFLYLRRNTTPAAGIQLEDLITQEGFFALLDKLFLPPPDLKAYAAVKDVKANATTAERLKLPPPLDVPQSLIREWDAKRIQLYQAY